MSAPTRTRGGDSTSPLIPGCPIAMSRGTWEYFTGREDGGPFRGVYRYEGQGDNRRRLPMGPLPYVLERIIRRDGAGRVVAVDYRIATDPLGQGGNVALVDDEALRTGQWAERLDVALSADSQVCAAVAGAIRDDARRAARAVELAPRWDGGTLHLPPDDVGPPGYRLRNGPEDDARRVWTQIAHLAADAPKLALVLGASLGGVYVKPLDRKSFMVHLVGDSGGGKTTALTLAASIYGDPSDEAAVRSWDNSAIGLVQELGTYAVLPMFRDELGAGGYNPRELEKLIFRITQGGSRTTGGTTGRHRISAPWHGTLIATGNDSILGEITNEGIARRVLEIATPITRDADAAEQLEALAHQAHGWPLHWLQEAGVTTPETFGELVAAAEEQLPLPAGGVPRGLGRHLALAVAGAALLEQLIGCDAGLQAAALTAARELLDDMIREVTEHGISTADRLLAAIREAVTARPAAYPTRGHYADDLRKGYGLPREVEGWLLTDDPSIDGDVAVLTQRLTTIARDAGITNPRTGLRELDKRRVLVRSRETDRRLRQRLRVAGEKTSPSVYVLRLDDGTGPAPGATGPDQTGNEPGQPGTPPPQPGTNGPTGNTTGNSGCGPLTSTNVHAATVATPGVPGVPGCGEHPPHDSATGAVVTGRAGPVWTTDRPEAPCRICQTPSRACVDKLGPVHPRCAMQPEAAPPTASTSSSPTGDNGQSLAPRMDATVVPRLIARAKQKAREQGFTEGYAEGMETVQWFAGERPAPPAGEDTGPRPGDYTGGPVVWNIDQAQPRRDEQAAESGSEGRSAPAGADTPAPRREAASKPQGRPDTAAAADDPKELERCARLIREDYPDATDADIATAYRLFRQVTSRKVDGGLRMIGDPGFVGLKSVQIVRDGHNGSVRTAPLDSELVDGISHGGDLFRYADHVQAGAELGEGDPVTVLDSNSAWLAAAQSCELGDSAPAHYTRPRTIRQVTAQSKWSKRPGYVLLGAAPDLAAELPGLASLGRGSWVPTPWVDFLLNPWPGRGPLLGSDLEIAELVYWHKGDHGRRLSTWAAFMRDAGLALTGMDGLAARYALKLVKRVRNGLLGGYLRSERYNRTELLRPDWSDLIVTQAGANLMRKLTRAALEHGAPHPIGVYRDDVWYAADRPPAALVDAGEVDPTKLGKLKVKGTIATTAELAAAMADRSTFNASTAVAAALRQVQP